jgi:hypothetical protein
MVKELPYYAERVKRYIDLITEHRAWTLMNRLDGSMFSSFEDFCETKEPYGLGRPPGEIRAYLEARFGRAAVQLATVAPGRPGNQHTLSVPGTESSNDRKGQFLRAILRAPVEVQDLYREELISQKLAAKLGPKDPSKAPSRERVVEALAPVPRERKAIDSAVRELIGAKRDAVRDVVRAFLRLDAKQRRRFYDEVEKVSK